MKLEQIKFDDLRRSSRLFGEVLFIRALMMKQKELGIEDVRKVAPHPSGDDSQPMEIVLTVNGVQLPFLATLDALKESLGDFDREELEEFFSKKFGPIDELFADIRTRLMEGVIKLLDDKFPDSARRRMERE